MALAGVFVGGWILAVGLAALVGVIAWEWSGITMAGSGEATAYVAIPGMASVFAVQSGSFALGLALIAIGAGIAFLRFRNFWAPVGVVYAAAFGTALVILRLDPFFGIEALLFLFAVVWGSDIGAYVAGRTIGGPKLWPRVSPKKTWSGFIGGTIAGVAGGLLVAAVSGVPISTTLAAVAVILSIVAAGGDLFESAVKRRFGKKDASNLIPGHGGVMDRVDGLLAAGTVAALVGVIHAAWPVVGTGLLLW